MTVAPVRPQRPARVVRSRRRPPLASVRGLQKPPTAAAFSHSQLRHFMEGGGRYCEEYLRRREQCRLINVVPKDPEHSSRPCNSHMLAGSQRGALYLPPLNGCCFAHKIRHMTSTYDLITAREQRKREDYSVHNVRVVDDLGIY